MSNDLDIIKMFEQDFSTEIPDRPEERDTIGYKYVDLCNNQGNFIGRLLADSNGKIFRRLDDVIIGRLPLVDEPDKTMYIRFASINNFLRSDIKLTDEQSKLLNDIQKLFDSHWDHFEDVLKFKLSRYHFIFYFFIQYYHRNWNNEEKSFSNPAPTVVVHRSARFLDAFKSAVTNMNTARGDKEWLKNYANRDLGTTAWMTSISTTRTTGYETNITFQELPARKIEIKQEDLDNAKDIYAEYINVREFNTELYQEMYDNLKKYCDQLDLEKGLVDHNPDKSNKNI